MNGGQNYCLFSCANQGGPLSVVKISALTDFQAIHAKQWYWMVSIQGRPLSVMKVLHTPRKGQGEAKLN